jgi:glycogen synthase
MKILLSNKFYYPRGGDCIFTFNLEQMLKAHGHEVAVFAMDYPENLESPWEKYFPQNMSKLMAFTRPFGDREVKDKFKRLVDEFQPDVVHLNNIHTQLSPVIAKIAHERGIRVVWTLHDSKLVCPCYTCMRKGKWCTECFTDKKAVISHRCMPGGIIGSTIGYLEAMN